MIDNRLQIIDSKEKNKNLKYIYFLFGVFLNQTMSLFGFNFSFADIIAIILIIHIIYCGLELPYIQSIFFCVLSILLIFIPTFILPFYLNIYIEGTSILKNYFKYLVSFVYFILGYNIVKKRENEWYIFDGFLKASIIISILGIIGVIANDSFIKSNLFLGGVRFKGIINDPNYFAVHQICSFVIVLISIKKTNKRLITLFILGISILISGSKTGIISWFIMILIFTIYKFIDIKINNKQIIKKLILFIIIIIFILINKDNLLNILRNLSENVPSIERISKLVTNFSEAITGGGSSRSDTWEIAFNIMKLSPVTGIGAGSYITIANRFFNQPLLAHNTYLQLLCEWGIPLATIFFLWVLYNCYWAIRIEKYKFYLKNRLIIKTNGYIILVFLLGSLSISLNNARLFWLSLGVTLALRKS
ncbi:O-antigen ligase family protein [Clostridium perfringens]|uniref:O-antigen ligase family protein n=1 Tax=Clostridium perfringens TaxID=1502 RepID=UPI002A5F9A63|nr:O-antigen ligase family protein [Clostridium perfringens]MDJ8935348.1 O-antigen ligase family protein [Clostridium perfringens]